MKMPLTWENVGEVAKYNKAQNIQNYNHSSISIAWDELLHSWL